MKYAFILLTLLSHAAHAEVLAPEHGAWIGMVHKGKIGEATHTALQTEYRNQGSNLLLLRFGFTHDLPHGLFVESGLDRFQSASGEIRIWQGVGFAKPWIPDWFSSLTKFRLETRLSDSTGLGMRGRLLVDLGGPLGFHLFDEAFGVFKSISVKEKRFVSRNWFGMTWNHNFPHHLGLQVGGMLETIVKPDLSTNNGFVLIVRPSISF